MGPLLLLSGHLSYPHSIDGLNHNLPPSSSMFDSKLTSIKKKKKKKKKTKTLKFEWLMNFL
jgi:hypothetical protein